MRIEWEGAPPPSDIAHLFPQYQKFKPRHMSVPRDALVEVDTRLDSTRWRIAYDSFSDSYHMTWLEPVQ